jgi:hypothetical protein
VHVCNNACTYIRLRKCVLQIAMLDRMDWIWTQSAGQNTNHVREHSHTRRRRLIEHHFFYACCDLGGDGDLHVVPACCARAIWVPLKENCDHRHMSSQGITYICKNMFYCVFRYACFHSTRMPNWAWIHWLQRHSG